MWPVFGNTRVVAPGKSVAVSSGDGASCPVARWGHQRIAEHPGDRVAVLGEAAGDDEVAGPAERSDPVGVGRWRASGSCSIQSSFEDRGEAEVLDARLLRRSSPRPTRRVAGSAATTGWRWPSSPAPRAARRCWGSRGARPADLRRPRAAEPRRPAAAVARPVRRRVATRGADHQPAHVADEADLPHPHRPRRHERIERRGQVLPVGGDVAAGVVADVDGRHAVVGGEAGPVGGGGVAGGNPQMVARPISPCTSTHRRPVASGTASERPAWSSGSTPPRRGGPSWVSRATNPARRGRRRTGR